jgi:hypothetical protein
VRTRANEAARVEVSLTVPRRFARRHGLTRRRGGRPVRVGRRAARLQAGRYLHLRVALSRRARGALADAERVPLTMEARATDRAGNRSGVVRHRVVLRAP